MSREGIKKDRVPKIPEQMDMGFSEEDVKSPKVLKEKDFPFSLQDEVKAIKEREKISPSCVITFQNKALYVDDLPLERWVHLRSAYLEEDGFGNVRPENMIWRNGYWQEAMQK